MGGNTFSTRFSSIVIAAVLGSGLPCTGNAAINKRVDSRGVVRAMYDVGYSGHGIKDTMLTKVFLRQHSGALGINDVDSEFQFVDAKRIGMGSHIRLAQVYKGIPVHGGEIILSTTANGDVGMLINNYRANIRLSTASRQIGAASAIAAVRATFPPNTKLVGQKEDAILMIWQDEKNTYHLTYRIRLTTENPAGDWEAFVDAKDGSILRIENRFANSGETHVQGSGYVYLTDPLSAAKKRYGAAGFVDNADGDSDSLNFYRSRVTLDSLTFDNGVYKLKGPYCEITDIESPVDEQYVSLDRDGFSFTRSQQAFEAVNAYYHISRSYQYIQSLGFSSASLAAIRVDPHGLNGADNSHYSPNGNWIAFGEGGIDDAEDVDAILHEYAHAIVFNFCPSWGGGESGALGEGYSDYWAASYSRSAKGWASTTYEYNWVYNWNAHNMFQLGRSLNDARTYPFATNDVHDAGQIWSSALMAIWNDLGKETTDKLVLKSLFYLGAGTTGTDAAQALIQADRDLFAGAHVATLVHWLGTVKHFIAPANYIPEISHTPLRDMPLSAWAPPIVSARVSQVNPVEAVWVEFKINSGDVQGFALTEIESGVFAAGFPVLPSVLRAGDTVHYKINARYVGNRQAVAANPDVNYYSFAITGSPTSIEMPEKPLGFALGQNYPNPFNPSTNIAYSLPERANINLRIYNTLGQEVATLVSAFQEKGAHVATWNGANASGGRAASGSYIYRLEVMTESGQRFTSQKKMIYLR